MPLKNKVYGYLRGSTGDIDKNNQKDAISKVAKSRNIKDIPKIPCSPCDEQGYKIVQNPKFSLARTL
jgi:hypothetical protein